MIYSSQNQNHEQSSAYQTMDHQNPIFNEALAEQIISINTNETNAEAQERGMSKRFKEIIERPKSAKIDKHRVQ